MTSYDLRMHLLFLSGVSQTNRNLYSLKQAKFDSATMSDHTKIRSACFTFRVGYIFHSQRLRIFCH